MRDRLLSRLAWVVLAAVLAMGVIGGVYLRRGASADDVFGIPFFAFAVVGAVRHKYDATETLDVFSSRLRDQVDLNALNHELVGVVARTVQPAHVSVWLRRDDGVKS